jgi:hypothetical protein
VIVTSTDVEAAVARYMRAQRSQITLAQALACGMTEGEIRGRRDRGLWMMDASGLYRSAEAPVTWQQRAFGACLISGPGAVLSRRSSAVVWDAAGFRPGGIEILVPLGRSSRNPLAKVRRTSDLPATDVTRRDGLPVTRPIRMLVDIAGDISIELLSDAVDDLVIRRLVPLEELRARALVANGRGSANLRRVLEAWTPGPLPGSLNEMQVIRWLLAHGVPLGERQYVIRDERGRFVAKVDYAWPFTKAALEVQSLRWHGTPRGLGRDDRRHPKIRALGWQLFTRELGDDLTSLIQFLERAKRVA